jgi:ribose transport system ATP-binding protein
VQLRSKIKQSRILKNNIRYVALFGIIILFYILFAFISDSFFTFNTTMNIFRQSAALSLAAIGMTMIILTGGIDLSVGSTVAFAGAVGAIVMQSVGTQGTLANALLGMLVVIATAVLVGLINGFAAGYLKIAPFIVTLATMSLARGLTLTITNSSRILIDNRYFNFIGLSNIIGKIPASLILVIIAYTLAFLLLHKTTFGRKTYAIGDNPIASRASGINVERQTMMVYAVAGIFVGLSTIVLLGRAQTAQPLAGVGMEFEVITAAVLGGVSLFGGVGNLKGTLLGVILISVIFTGLGMLDIPPFINYLVKGSLIIVAVVGNQAIIEKAYSIPKAPKSDEKKEDQSGDNAAVIKMIENDEQQVLSVRNISKSFPGVKALDNVSLDVRRGTVHAICGENGAGKSTLMKILSGVYSKDAGEILINGHPVTIASPIDAEKLGISIIYQELANIPELSVYNNVNLGKEITRKGGLLLNRAEMIAKTKNLLKRFDLQINVNQKIDNLTVGQQQMVEIAKAYGNSTWIMIMDEPTSAISEADKDRLFEIIRELKENNVAIIYISHRMSEIFEIADEITVLRDGQHVITSPVDEIDEDKVIMSMVGRDIGDVFTREKSKIGPPVLEVKNLSRKKAFEPISFEVRAGEVLGFSGLVGAGRTEIMRCIFGLDKADSGEIYLNGKKLNIKSPADAIREGILLVSEDRRREGIIPDMAVRENITLASLSLISKLGWINKTKDVAIAKEYIDKLNIRTPSAEHLISNLSGGNQQKVCLAKWLNLNPKVVIMDEPTRGIDVGAKAEIHKLIEMLTKQGIAIIMISSEMPEIMGVSDRIIVLYEGKKTGEFISDESLTQEMLMKSAAGIP